MDLDAAGLMSEGAAGQHQEPAGVGQEGRTRGGQLHRSVVPIEQPDADLSLQLLDLTAERVQLGYREPLGSPTEVQLLGDRDESTDLIEGEHDTRTVSSDA